MSSIPPSGRRCRTRGTMDLMPRMVVGRLLVGVTRRCHILLSGRFVTVASVYAGSWAHAFWSTLYSLGRGRPVPDSRVCETRGNDASDATEPAHLSQLFPRRNGRTRILLRRVVVGVGSRLCGTKALQQTCALVQLDTSSKVRFSCPLFPCILGTPRFSGLKGEFHSNLYATRPW